MAPKNYSPAPWDDDLPEVDPDDDFDAEPDYHEERDEMTEQIERRGIDADDNLFH